MPDIALFAPHQLTSPGDIGPPPLEQFPLQFLAQGDSWFSLGAFPPMLTTNLFDKMSLRIAACAVNCASPGLKLHRMTDTTRQRVFLNLLSANVARRWAGLLISGGGNDVIEAAGAGPEHPAQRRLLARREEWTQAEGGERYLSAAGWQTFSDHITQVFRNLIDARDKGINRGIPVVVHTYDFATPRNSPAGPGIGPWLFPAVKAFGIPQEDWALVGRALLLKLGALIKEIAANTADKSIHVVDTQGTLEPAQVDVRVPTRDWQNEIHPTPGGYRRLGDKWEAVLTEVFIDRLAEPEAAPPPVRARIDDVLVAASTAGQDVAVVTATTIVTVPSDAAGKPLH